MGLFGLDGVCTAANPALQQMLDRTEEEIVGHNVLELNHEDERAATADAWAKFRSGSLTERHSEKKYVKKDGGPVWLNITTTVVPATETAAAFLQAVYVDVTSRVQFEAALRASEERWRTVFETAAVGIAMGDLDGGVLGMNPTFQRMIGYTEDEVRNLTVYEFTHEDDRAETRRLFGGIVSGPQRSYRVEKRYRRKDGATIWADVAASMVPATDTTPAFLAVMAVDITDRKRAEAALRASEERWRAMFEIAPVGIATFEFERRRYLTANESFQRMTGYTEAELRNLTTLEITHEDDRAGTQERIDSGAVGVLQSKRYRRKDGEVVWADVTAFIIPATDSTPAFLGAVIVDITDRKRAEDALRQSEAYLHEVFETLPDGVAIIGRDYRYQRVNPIYEHRTGLARGQIAGMHVADINGVEAFNETIKRELDRCFAGEHVSYGDWFTHAASGRRYLAVTYSPLFVGSPQRPGAVLAITRDLTDYMLASEALRQAQADLARLHRVMLLGEMTASIAHEINQPIAAVVTNAHAGLRWLGAQQPDMGEARQALGRIVRDGTRASEVIDRIRALVRKVPPRRDDANINEAIREVIALTQTDMQSNGVRLQMQLADDLPLVPADRVQLQQVIMNLIVNAVEAMTTVGNRSRELTIASGKSDANAVVVEVQDTGPGIDPADLDRLFQSFYTTKPDGIGMGLAISRSIVEAHGGRLSAAPNQPRGAAFRFTLPVEEQSSRGHSVPPR
jgi:PAS domain S-box-containing protein